MKLPEWVQVGPIRYTVVSDAAAIAIRGQAERAGLFGHTHYAEQVITLDPALGPDKTAEVLLHEVAHAVLEQLATELAEDVQERAAQAVGVGLLDTLRRNPDLVKFLTA